MSAMRVTWRWKARMKAGWIYIVAVVFFGGSTALQSRATHLQKQPEAQQVSPIFSSTNIAKGTSKLAEVHSSVSLSG